MVGEKIAKQMLDLQKATVNQSYDTMLMWQDHSEKILQTMMEQATWMPDESKQVVDGWISTLKQNEIDCKQMLDDYFMSIEKFFTTEADAPKPVKAAPKAASKTAK